MSGYSRSSQSLVRGTLKVCDVKATQTPLAFVTR